MSGLDSYIIFIFVIMVMTVWECVDVMTLRDNPTDERNNVQFATDRAAFLTTTGV